MRYSALDPVAKAAILRLVERNSASGEPVDLGSQTCRCAIETATIGHCEFEGMQCDCTLHWAGIQKLGAKRFGIGRGKGNGAH